MPSRKNLGLATIAPDGLALDGLGIDLRYHNRSHVQHGGSQSERLTSLGKYLVMKNYLVSPLAVAVSALRAAALEVRGTTGSVFITSNYVFN